MSKEEHCILNDDQPKVRGRAYDSAQTAYGHSQVISVTPRLGCCSKGATHRMSKPINGARNERQPASNTCDEHEKQCIYHCP